MTIASHVSRYFPGQLKEIVLLTKSSNGGGGGCCGPSSHGSSYSAPPSSSYGAPSGGGGWGRSFHKRPMTLSYVDGTIKTANDSNRMTKEATTEYVDYPDYQDYREPSAIANLNLTTSRHWNTTHDVAFYRYGDDVGTVRNSSQPKSMTDAKGRRRLTFDEYLSDGKVDINDERANARSEPTTNTSTNRPDSTQDTNLYAYADEWQATAGKMSQPDVSSSNSNAIVELRRIEPRSRDVPLLRGI